MGDIPMLDPYRHKMKKTLSGINTFSFGQDLVFEAYIQYKEYIGFVKAMNALKGMKLVTKTERAVEPGQAASRLTLTSQSTCPTLRSSRGGRRGRDSSRRKRRKSLQRIRGKILRRCRNPRNYKSLRKKRERKKKRRWPKHSFLRSEEWPGRKKEKLSVSGRWD